ncbi:rhamnan synthesis F family protein [Tardiphaga sp. vice278]|uniref:rhamnan synthesis F family protein n=1 Tax=Tardiphaga sp. vice278 TaxID=2592815 RepID=UPI00143DA5CB|nr:rhamnan synthesis F family protein [Tardiphaga sp. vice278]
MRHFGYMARTLLALWFLLQDSVVWLFGNVIRRGNYVRAVIPAEDPLVDSKLAAVYVHFDRRGIVHDYILHQLRELAACGFRITFVTNAPEFPESSKQRVSPLCKSIIWRNNTGYDFGAYKDGIAANDLDQLDGLILMNDSVYGPFWPLAETLSAMSTAHVDFWGIVDNFEHQYHLQTFFVYFLPKAIQSDAFRSFWRSHPYINNKGWVVRNGEVGLTQALARQELRGGALAPYWRVSERVRDRLPAPSAEIFANRKSTPGRVRSALLRGRGINSMHYFWDELITEDRCPFIKRELLTRNPARVPFTDRWPDIIRSHSAYDVDLIRRHLDS